MTQPFLKWAGGKRKLVPEIMKLMPKKFGNYHEPFVGGGALFWGLETCQDFQAFLSDRNSRLVDTYVAIRDDVEAVMDELRTYPYEKEFYLRTRTQLDEGPSAQRAARFIYVNRAGFNGMYRVNSRGEFNIPFGRYTNPTICDEERLRDCSRALQDVQVQHEDFTEAASRAIGGDFVYFDPPYLPISKTSDFTGYTPGGFSLEDHRRLCNVARTLAARGVYVLISNSNAPAILELYADGFDIKPVQMTRSINANGKGRGSVEELLIQPKR
jgi:DNA adenine methylase